jgi:F0F1-type ATP synthase delta subunit
MMQNEETYFEEILTGISTKEEKNLLLDEVDSLLASLYKTKKSAFDVVLDSLVRVSTAKVIRKAVLNGIDKKKFLEALKDRLEKMGSIKLTLAFEPTKAITDEIHEWIKNNLAKDTLIETQVNKNILGGAIISFNGHFVDRSLDKSLNEYFKSHEY